MQSLIGSLEKESAAKETQENLHRGIVTWFGA